MTYKIERELTFLVRRTSLNGEKIGYAYNAMVCLPASINERPVKTWYGDLSEEGATRLNVPSTFNPVELAKRLARGYSGRVCHSVGTAYALLSIPMDNLGVLMADIQSNSRKYSQNNLENKSSN